MAMVYGGLSGLYFSAEAEAAARSAPIKLKLDYDLVPRLDAPGADARSLIESARPAELQGRVLKVQDQVRSMAETNEEKTRLLAERQRVLASIQGIVRAQDKMIEVLKTEIARPAPASASAVAPVPKASPAAAAPAPMAPIQIGPAEVPAWLAPWLVEGTLGVIIVLLLGTTFHLRASAKAKDAELAALSSGIVTTDGGALTEVPAAYEPVADHRDTDGFSAALEAAPEEQDSMAQPPEVEIAEQNPLTEVDTLIADEQFDGARRMLQELIDNEPANPEFRLRMLHVESRLGDGEKAAEEEAILSQMMDGPMSDTMHRVKEIGRGLLPGHPLFDDQASADEARRILDEHEQKKVISDTRTDDLDAGSGDDGDGESMDFLSDIFGDDEELAKKFSDDSKSSS